MCLSMRVDFGGCDRTTTTTSLQTSFKQRYHRRYSNRLVPSPLLISSVCEPTSVWRHLVSGYPFSQAPRSRIYLSFMKCYTLYTSLSFPLYCSRGKQTFSQLRLISPELMKLTFSSVAWRKSRPLKDSTSCAEFCARNEQLCVCGILV